MKPVSLVPFLLAYLLGIPFAFTQPSELCFLLVFFGAFWCTYCWKFRGDPWYFLLIIGFFLLGLGRGNLQLILPKKHYSHFVNPQAENQFIVRFTQALNNHRFDHRYYGEVLWTNTHKSEGKILVSINKNIPVEVMVGEEYQYRGRLHPMEKPKNPFDFDYAKHLKQQGIYHHLRIKDSSRVLLHQKNPSLLQRLNRLLTLKIENSGWKIPTQQIIKTMVLGQRNTLESDTRKSYADTGVIHLFAISGLHIGLLMVFFQWLFQPLRYLPHGSILQHIMVLALLWSYAFMVGASASVLRAVTLFSSFQLAKLSHRKPPTAYMVLLSMGVLLTVNPRYIFQLGFQMSYLAVFGILFFQPLMEIRWSTKICRWFWTLTTVSLSAQLAVAPLSIYHFHQFPGLFLLSNWILIPFVGFFLYSCIGCLIYLLFFPLPGGLIVGMDWVVYAMNQWVLWVSNQRHFLMTELILDRSTTYLCYFVLLSFYWLIQLKKWPFWGLFFVGVLGMQWQLQTHRSKPKQNFWIGQRYGKSILIAQKSRSLCIYSNDSISPAHRLVQSFKRNLPHDTLLFLPLKNHYQLGEQTLYIVDGPWANAFNFRRGSILVIQKNPKVNMERILLKSAPAMVVIDGSNTPYYISRWRRTLNAYAIDYWLTHERGAYRVNLESVE